ncbi:MAG: recombinase family protein [Clostridium sp.]|nr:recombinase family protein [Clostridium sp.]
MLGKKWFVAIYARVSTDKKDQKESIPAQIDSLQKWLKNKIKDDKLNEYKLIDIYEDQGFSGSSFKRDSFIRMKKDIENKRINMVLTRDLSRFSRNYIMAGYYLEEYFKIKNVRFISVLDNVDTNYENNDIIPFKNILNEMYVRDCSRRTRDGLIERMNRGSCISSKPPYGYKFDIKYIDNVKYVNLSPETNGTQVIVKIIFKLYINGFGLQKIADCLNVRGVPSPKAIRLGEDKSLWTNNTVKYILTNPKYTGKMVQHRWKKINYKINKSVKVPRNEWITKGTFKAIIGDKMFNSVQNIMRKRQKSYRCPNDSHIFSSIIFCGDCGSPMYYRKNFKGYKCKRSQEGGKKCSAHSIKEELILEKIIEEIRKCTSAQKIDKYLVKFDKEAANKLIKKILVYEDKASEVKKVDIFFKFKLV